jgi:hypothetical protein
MLGEFIRCRTNAMSYVGHRVKTIEYVGGDVGLLQYVQIGHRM